MTPKEKLEADNSKPNQEAILFAKQSKEYAQLRTLALKRLIGKEYEKLKTELKSYPANYIKDFFLQEGKIILDYAIIETENAGPLLFLINNLPSDLLKKTLNDNDYYIFKSFLRGESSLEGTRYDNQESDVIRMEKFKLLLSLDAIGIGNFIQRNASESYLTKKIKNQIYIAAHEQHKKLNSLS